MKVLNFNDTYVDRKGDINNLGDVLSDTSVDLTDYAKKTDIPATLPANGGNADTVNNHTVESNVPENAVFTDTIYDDTAVKGSIDEIKNDLIASNAGAHNSIYRGKYLGNVLTKEQKAQISAGTFNDLYIGDYWTINEVNYRIAAFDYWFNCGDTPCEEHHVVIITDTSLYNAKMNTTNVTTGGYVGSAMYTSNLENAKTIINNAFGSAVLTHRELLTNEVTNGCPSKGSWYDSSVEMPNEPMMYGSYINAPALDGKIFSYRHTIDKSQMALFTFCPNFISNRQSFWLRDIVSDKDFAYIGIPGISNFAPATTEIGVRPVFGIKG